MTDEIAIASRGLTKRFGRQAAVDGIDLAVPRGAVYGFLGPNGSGKTTTIRMLLGLVRPTAGTHELLGQAMPAAAARVLPRVGSLVEGPAFHPYLSGAATLARLDAADRTADPATARQRIGAALERVGLLAAAGKRYRAYSLGMRQRLALASAMVGDPDVLVLDEPANGLDPTGIHWLRGFLRAKAADGRTVLVASHVLAEMEHTADRVVIVDRGRLVAEGAVADLSAGRSGLEAAYLERVGGTR